MNSLQNNSKIQMFQCCQKLIFNELEIEKQTCRMMFSRDLILTAAFSVTRQSLLFLATFVI